MYFFDNQYLPFFNTNEKQQEALDFTDCYQKNLSKNKKKMVMTFRERSITIVFANSLSTHTQASFKLVCFTCGLTLIDNTYEIHNCEKIFI